MDRKAIWEKTKVIAKKTFTYTVGTAVLVTVLSLGMVAGPLIVNHLPNHGKWSKFAILLGRAPAKEEKIKPKGHGADAEKKKEEMDQVADVLHGGLTLPFISIQRKMDVLRKAEQENYQLRLETAHLRERVTSLSFDCSAKDTSGASKLLSMRMETETGSRVGRTLASITYRPPSHLLPPQMYTLAASYIKAHKDEKAAVILTFLTGLEENDAFKTAKNYLATGVEWYRADNFELADQYFDDVLKMPETKEVLQNQAQARLWKALVAERLGKHTKAQQWLRDLVDQHPRSIETGWINAKEMERVPVPTEED